MSHSRRQDAAGQSAAVDANELSAAWNARDGKCRMGHSLRHRRIPGSLVEGKRQQAAGSDSVDSLIQAFCMRPFDGSISQDRKMLRRYMKDNPRLASHLLDGNRQLRTGLVSNDAQDASRFLERVPSGRSGVHSYNTEIVHPVSSGQSSSGASMARRTEGTVDTKRQSVSPLRKSFQQEADDLKLGWMSLENATSDSLRRAEQDEANTKLRMYLVPHTLDHRDDLQAELIDASMKGGVIDSREAGDT